MRYSESWRAHRRIVHQWLRPEAIPSYHPLLTFRVHVLLSNLLDEPENAYELLKQCVLLSAAVSLPDVMRECGTSGYAYGCD